MPYTTNPNMPRIRREAAALVRSGWSTRKVARHFGFSQSVVVKWKKKAEGLGLHPIPTLSSRPRHHPREISEALRAKIVQKRLGTKRCAEVVHAELRRDGVAVSLSSVKRTLDRRGLLKKRSPWKRFHPHQERPLAIRPGDLVEMDTVHLMCGEKKRVYVFTLLDVRSRYAYAKAYARMNGRTSVHFLREAERSAPFRFSMIQTDHGPEFSSWFVSRIAASHRHTRIGKPNDNAHIERFNRTLQEECLDGIPPSPRRLNAALRNYIPHYNSKRLHLGLGLQAPMEFIGKAIPSY